MCFEQPSHRGGPCQRIHRHHRQVQQAVDLAESRGVDRGFCVQAELRANASHHIDDEDVRVGRQRSKQPVAQLHHVLRWSCVTRCALVGQGLEVAAEHNAVLAQH